MHAVLSSSQPDCDCRCVTIHPPSACTYIHGLRVCCWELQKHCVVGRIPDIDRKMLLVQQFAHLWGELSPLALLWHMVGKLVVSAFLCHCSLAILFKTNVANGLPTQWRKKERKQQSSPLLVSIFRSVYTHPRRISSPCQWGPYGLVQNLGSGTGELLITATKDKGALEFSLGDSSWLQLNPGFVTQASSVDFQLTNTAYALKFLDFECFCSAVNRDFVPEIFLHKYLQQNLRLLVRWECLLFSAFLGTIYQRFTCVSNTQ